MSNSSNEAGAPMLQLTRVSKTFNRGTANEKVAIWPMDLTIERGDFVTIIGGNGAGKSTLLNLIAGVFLPDGGTVVIDGTDVSLDSEPKRARYLGRVFQDPMRGTASDMQIAENMALAYRRGTTRGLQRGVTAEERTLFKEKLATLGLGLEDRLSSKVGLLSGGQRQALTLLMATLKRPDVLLLDEPTAALDPATAAKVTNLIHEIVDGEGLTALMVTHNMSDALRLGNRLIMMSEGRIIYDVRGEEKQALVVADLLKKFEEVSGQAFDNDRMLLG